MRKFLFLCAVIDGLLTGVILVTPTRSLRALAAGQVLGNSVEANLNLETYWNNQDISSKSSGVLTFGDITATASSVLESTPAAEPSRAATPSPTPKLSPSSSHLTIAILGDSMVDTLGPDLPHLANLLKQQFPKITFTLLNYGAAATDIEYGLTRLTNDYSYLGRSVPALLTQNPDIVVIESFAYNHWENTQSDLDRQWLTLNKIIETIKSHPPAGGSNTKIVLAATIAPYCPTYTDRSANLPPERKFKECETVKAYLQNLVNFATSQHYPLADAYHTSLRGNEGNPLYINSGDHLHPSNEGKQLFSNKVAETLTQILL